MDKAPSRAILISPGFNHATQPILGTKPSLLLNIADKPIIFHILDQLHRLRFHTVDLILHHFPEQIEDRLDAGARWGMKVRYHLAKKSCIPFSSIKAVLSETSQEMILVGWGDSMPRFPGPLMNEALYVTPRGDWTGWVAASANRFKNIPSETPYEEFQPYLKHLPEVTIEPSISARSYLELKESNQKALEGKDPTFLFPTTTKKVEEGVWISRAVTMEPGSEIVPPVLIGENTLIKSGARLGPHAVIENHCIVDEGSIIENSVILQKSYVGEGLEVRNCIIDRNTLINLTLNTQLSIRDEFIISDSFPPARTGTVQRLFERAAASLLFILLLPFFLVLLLLYSIKREEKVLLPASDSPEQWKMFDLLTFDVPSGNNSKGLIKFIKGIPRILNVIKGEVSLVGTEPRSFEETKSLPSDWRKLYLTTKAGIITLYNSSSDDDRYAADSYYAAMKSWWLDIKILIKTIIGKLW